MILFSCKKALLVIPVGIWFHRLVIVSRILSCVFEGDGIISQMEGYFSVLLFIILLCHIGL